MLKKTFLLLASLTLISQSLLATPIKRSEQDIDKEVTHLLSKMTIEEKVGQMTQITLAVILDKGSRETGDGLVIDKEKLKKAIHTYKVGSILNSTATALTVKQWNRLIKEIQDEALQTPNKLPVIYGVDAIHGVTYTKGSTLYPHNIGLAATRNLKLAKATAKATGKELRATGVRWNFDPVLDLGVNPIWSRFSETYGEDTYLTTQMGVGVIQAYEEDGLENTTAVASTMKHFIGYSDPANGKDRTPAYIPDIVLWEKYLPQFKAAVDAGSSSIMINSASVNGIPVHGSKRLLTDLLRGELGFKGLVVTDWEDVIRLHTRHMVAESPREAVKQAVDAGIDMSMVPKDFSFYELLVDLVKSGDISEARIDKSVGIILKLKYQLGLFDNAYHEAEAAKNFGKAEYKNLALKAARESITLLKNDNDILPLPKNAKILLAGPTGHSHAPLNGSWSYSWQGDVEANYPENEKTILDAFHRAVGKKNLITHTYAGFNNEKNYDVEGLITKAKKADYIVLALGENAYAESPGALDDLNLANNQMALAQAALSTGKPVIVVLAEGRPRIIKDIVGATKAIVQAYIPGSQGAQAISDVIFGDYNPNGKLPYSYPQCTGDFANYDRVYLNDIQQLTPGDMSYNGYKPQWPFGHGLSYTTFAYSNIKLSSKTLKGDNKLNISVKVTNTGKFEGKESVELYVSDLFASVSPAVKRLKAFKKINLKAGQSKQVNFSISKGDLTFVNPKLKRIVEEGEFTLAIGSEKINFHYQF
ncbi:beta-glucosidase [Colwellia sp. 75C3]|uniref:glycoside hydrolase family 3 N-terminal domain-containing protein n=1 Tax=Colwellia sp. 75C3 TaxID=888425 RepID=UPI000C32FCEA|nr:glycoside hydrolase family 3 N-terminal domain-containing protein [Colwellia sp. 75C3]PKG81851.1 beta-glucosidase [Colwellia sp. 75C3]